MRVKINLKCSSCDSINYLTSKNSKTHPDKIEVLKYCPKAGSAVAGQFGYHAVFYATSLCVAFSCLFNLIQFRTLLKVKEI
ncbi:multi-drug resistance efflux pump [Streptococcus pneumoniae]|nr:multi-drug resistance efflux pump [Streptococcus pneumoniae]